MHNPHTKGRLFRFSLRTLFVVVTMACIWLAWEMNQFRERKEVLRLLEQSYEKMNVQIASAAPNEQSWIARYLGDTEIKWVSFPKQHEAALYDLLVRTRAAFPEVQFTEIVEQGPGAYSLGEFFGKNDELMSEQEKRIRRMFPRRHPRPPGSPTPPAIQPSTIRI